MTTYFRTKVVNDIGTTPVDVLATSTGNRYTLIGCNLANTIDTDVIVDIQITDGSSNTGYYIRQLVISPYTSAKVVTNGEKIILAENSTMTITSDTDNSVDMVASYAEIL
jgi:hypothetical protein